MKIEDNVLERIKNIKWFENCGMQTNTEINIPVTYVNSWVEAKESYQTTEWENTTLEASNELTSFLHDRCKPQYLNWNQLAREVRMYIDVEVLPEINIIKEKHNLDQIFIDCITWDISHAIMEATYKRCNVRKKFFLDLLSIYESGNFPCGWNGKWPEGTLWVY
ncbi:hypothetical protein [Bacillus sp. ISL-39]|uniref:hypothetical protein n=1 Tax=Bacillus sp. ISL-39 TaxID=2819124 RepID=UPI001BE65788|nr:hypothetical protein [Bacillus sp. ISL-39]MBT2639417.1 hypothetical protein [Bacillus sp. ISL-39]